MSELPWSARPAGRSVRYTCALLRFHGREVLERVAAPAAALIIWSALSRSMDLHVAAQLVIALAANAWLAVALHRTALTPDRPQAARPDPGTARYAIALLLIGLASMAILLPFRIALELGAHSLFAETNSASGPLGLLRALCIPMLGLGLYAALASRLLGAPLLLLPMLAIDEPVDYSRARRLVRPWTLDIAVLLFVVPAVFSSVAMAVELLSMVPMLSAVLGGIVDLAFATITVLLLSYLLQALTELEAAENSAADAVATAIADAQRRARPNASPTDRPDR